jgi:hypothetical protein
MIIRSVIKSIGFYIEFFKVGKKLLIGINLFLMIFLQSCRNEMVGQYIRY